MLDSELEVRVITLDSNPDKLHHVKKTFPNAGIADGVDVRNSNLNALLDARMITSTVAHTISNGRKWHFELPGLGAIGVQQAMRIAIGRRTDVPLLLFEDDAHIIDGDKLRSSISTLLKDSERFDIAVFGSKTSTGNGKGSHKPAWPGGKWRLANGLFILLHCVLYPAHARARIASMLEDPQDAQIDAQYGMWAKQGRLKILLHPTPSYVVQRREGHSNIQTDKCILCEIEPQLWQGNWKRFVLALIMFVCFVVLFVRFCVKRGATPCPVVKCKALEHSIIAVRS